ncbi:MAG TPA: hypothetical protein VLF64_03050 [Candidatus Saccharimonadales bacterium]|nr:hypothetical protein [Candidatus Saccharimonadales bacterium]
MAYVPYVGYALVWARSWVGIAALVYLPTLLILVEEVNRLSSYYRLALPYRLASYHRRAKQETHKSMLTVPMTGVFVVAIVVLAWQPIAHALFHSNTVAIIHNRLSISLPLCQNADNTNNISIMNTSTQTAASGSASGGSANSGNASNSNNTNINITITGSHC